MLSRSVATVRHVWLRPSHGEVRRAFGVLTSAITCPCEKQLRHDRLMAGRGRLRRSAQTRELGRYQPDNAHFVRVFSGLVLVRSVDPAGLQGRSPWLVSYPARCALGEAPLCGLFGWGARWETCATSGFLCGGMLAPRERVVASPCRRTIRLEPMTYDSWQPRGGDQAVIEETFSPDAVLAHLRERCENEQYDYDR